MAADLYPFLDASTTKRLAVTIKNGPFVEAPLRFLAGANSLADKALRIYDGKTGGKFANVLNRLMPAGNRSTDPLNAALIALYIATNGDNWTNNTNWDISGTPTPSELNTWYGVTVRQGEVTRLVMQDNNLVGPLPAELGELSGLVQLSLRINHISGEIPRELGNLSNLERLHLDNNLLSGTIPKELGNLSQLRVLNLGGNSLSGEIPKELSNLSQLNYLELWSNSFTGEIPGELGNLSELMYLRIAGTPLSGEIPKELANLSQLRDLWLPGNSLTGEIPKELGNLSQLNWLTLSRNSLTGGIPRELGNLSQLTHLWLRYNSLTGEIPKELGNLSQLKLLTLAGNSLSGTIPPELGSLSQLEFLGLYENSLTGDIPPQLGGLSKLYGLSLEDNSITGEIPPEFGNLSSLSSLRLHNNSLTGDIPPELGNLSQLKLLYLYGNSLSGEIPPELGKLEKLEELMLYDNSLTGALPRSLMQLDSLWFLYFEGQALCAPADGAFQAWLSTVRHVRGPTCSAVQFAGEVEDQAYTVGQAIPNLVLAEASGGLATLTYALEPPLPAGLAFNDATRTIAGTPAAVSPATSYTYSATDNAGSIASLTFMIEVVAAVAFQDMIADQSFPRAQPITPLVFPEATGGVPPIEYQLTPSLPTGLDFDAAIRILTGTPTEVTNSAIPYTYTATGANGSSDTLQFTIEVHSPVAGEHESLPESFAVHGNYPNPFRQSTRLVFDLPWPARVTAEVMDLTGRRVHAEPPAAFAAGWERRIELSGRAMSSGLYLYRLTATSPEGSSVHIGRFVRVR